MKRRELVLVLATGAVVGCVGEVGFSTRADAYSVPKPCKVPAVTGDALTAASTALTKAHCALGKVTTETSSKVAAGDVISESPAAGTSHSSGTAVALTVSLGSPAKTATCTVPKLAGLDTAFAESKLITHDCGVGKITTTTSKTVARGRVISSSPAASKTEAVGYKVKLTVSRGKPKAKK